MIEFFFEPFWDFAFMRRALVGCFALALGASPVGVFLTLRRMSLSGDAMSHAILPGAAIGYLIAGLSLGAMTLGGMLAGFLVTFLSGLIARNTVIKEDTSLAVFYLLSLASGVLIVSLKGNSVDLLHILFGSVLALDDAALLLIVGITSLSLVVLAIIYRPLVLECLDPGFLRSVSILSPWAHYGFLGLVVLNLIGGFHALGTLMAVGIMILPAASARFWNRNVDKMVLLVVPIAFFNSLGGLLLSYHANLPAGPAIILFLGGFYVFSLLLGKDGIITRRLNSKQHFRR